MIANILKYIKEKIIIQILIAIIICIFSYNHLSRETVSYVYAASLALRAILVFVLPFLIITAISTAFARIPRGGFGFALFILGAICISNFINLMISYFCGSVIMGMHNAPFTISGSVADPVKAAFELHLPQLIENKFALVIGLVIGISCSLFSLKKVELVANKANKVIMFFMSKIFIRFLPIFIAGSLLKLLVEGELFDLLRTQLTNSLSMIGLLLLYLLLWFLIAAGFKLTRLKEIFGNVAPAMITAFSTMSSAAALPLSIEAAEKNTKDPVLANSVVPISMNLHMLGDTICIPVMTLIIMTGFGFPLPSFSEFAIFGVYFILNKFAGAGIPGGTIMVTLSVLQSVFHFTPEMTGLITTVYMVFDPVATTGNVTANGLFVIFIQKILNFFKPKEIVAKEEEMDALSKDEQPS
jgi:Na+/H+-dicarboxylate symporter